MRSGNGSTSDQASIRGTYINDLIQPSQATANPQIEQSLDNLGKAYLMSSMDLSQGFWACKLADDESRRLSMMACQFGQYEWLSLPMGMANSPAEYNQRMNLLVHNEVVRDRKGNIKFVDKEAGIAELRPDRIPECEVYIDDLAISTAKFETEDRSLEEHFKIVEKVIKRVSDNNAKINVSKCKFA